MQELKRSMNSHRSLYDCTWSLTASLGCDRSAVRATLAARGDLKVLEALAKETA